jgi:multidrug resistance efflux pump
MKWFCIATILSPMALLAPAAVAQEQTVQLPAFVQAFEASDQYAKESGYVTEVKVDIGDHVSAGQVLVVIDDPELVKQVEAAHATLAARQETAKAADATVQQAQQAAQVAQAQLGVYKSDLELAQATCKRQEELFTAKAITDQQIDDARARLRATEAQVAVGEAKTAMAQVDIQAADAKRAVVQSQIAVADAELQRLQSLLQYTSIRAPFDGIVTRRNVNRGDLVTSGRSVALLTVQRIDVVRVCVDVPEASIGGLRVGAAASIKPYALSGTSIDAKVARVAGALDPASRTMRIEIDVPNPREQLRPGMYAQVTLALRPPAVAETPAKP